MGGSKDSGSEQVPRTDLCENCEREIVPEVESVTGQHELIHQAREADEDERFYPVTGGSVTIGFSCRCSHLKVEYGPGSTKVWDVPEEWMWEGDFDG